MSKDEEESGSYLPLPHGIAEKDVVSANPGELSCKRGEVLVLLEQKDNNYVHCQMGGIIGDVKVTNMKIITPLDESPENKQKDVPHRMEDSHMPHAVVLHDFAGGALSYHRVLLVVLGHIEKFIILDLMHFPSNQTFVLFLF
ncbi:unnamed protein product [Ranitomeya imitator]|uniref:SH3 domain-containing protein n=1 Tax=Ranitomeya imitator TaxID=111125 RepID=A0ABN9M563_9NEOB|nr:unnamed protein product [Ranitomeya imitator]